MLTVKAKKGRDTAEYWADWLVDAIATATQNRMFLRGDEECDEGLCEALYANAKHAIDLAIEEKEEKEMSREDAMQKEIDDLTGELKSLREKLRPLLLIVERLDRVTPRRPHAMLSRIGDILNIVQDELLPTWRAL